MNILKLSAMIAGVLCIAGGSFVVGQQTQVSLPARELNNLEARGDAGGYKFEDAKRVADIYAHAPSDSEVVKDIVRFSVANPRLANQNEIRLLALQVTQNQRLIEQNEQILAQLKKLNEKK